VFNRDNVLFVLYALATAAEAVAVNHGWISSGDALEVTAVLAAAATAYHIPNAKASAAIAESKQAATPLDAKAYLDAA
jgi:hypothetical protein